MNIPKEIGDAMANLDAEVVAADGLTAFGPAITPVRETTEAEERMLATGHAVGVREAVEPPPIPEDPPEACPHCTEAAMFRKAHEVDATKMHGFQKQWHREVWKCLACDGVAFRKYKWEPPSIVTR